VGNVFSFDRTAVAIAEQQPYVAGLQEVDVHRADRSELVDEDEATSLANRLDKHVFFGAIYDLPPLTAGGPDRLHGLTILTRDPILHAVNHEITHLPTQDPNPRPALAPGFPGGGDQRRGRRGPRLQHRPRLPVRSERPREASSGHASIVDREGGQQVNVGDFDATNEWSALTPLWSHLTDAMAATGQADTPTYPSPARGRIDYVTNTSQVTACSAWMPVTTATDHGGASFRDRRP